MLLLLFRCAADPRMVSWRTYGIRISQYLYGLLKLFEMTVGTILVNRQMVSPGVTRLGYSACSV